HDIQLPRWPATIPEHWYGEDLTVPGPFSVLDTWSSLPCPPRTQHTIFSMSPGQRSHTRLQH
ncbi:hypothetical protein P7K49_007483, partial [Saguinus oedipus]